MTALQERDKRTLESPWSRLDRLFDEWMRTMPVRRILGEAPGEEIIRVDEFRDDDTQVIRAELPGIDPDRDVRITVAGGRLRIDAERRVEEETTEENGFTRREMRYGSFTRTLPLAEGARDEITAGYSNGVLEIRVPLARPEEDAEPRTIPVTHD
jgi:HSP20 family protein